MMAVTCNGTIVSLRGCVNTYTWMTNRNGKR
jgi:hypothetical protein